MDPRADVRAHVALVRSWTPVDAARQASADLAAYHAPRASRTGDVDAMQHLREDMALRTRNSEPYRSQLQREDPHTLRDVLAQPIVPVRREVDATGPAIAPAAAVAQAPAERSGSSAARPEESVNVIAAVSSGKRALDTELDAQQRQAARASIPANDKQADAKREIVDHMTSDELKRFAAAGTDRPKAEQVLRDAASREERAAAAGPVREPVPPLAERFNIRRSVLTKEYEFRDRPGTVAFAERFSTLRSAQSSPAVAIAMIDRAGERGWSTVRVKGSAEFKRQAWIAAEARGIKAIGYEPTKGDIEAAQAERSRLEKFSGWQGGTVQRADEQPSPGASRMAPEQPQHRPSERGAQDPGAAAARTRQTEEAVRRDPGSDDERRSTSKEDRKVAEFAVMAGAPVPEQGGKGTTGASRDAAGAARDTTGVDVPSLASAEIDRGRRDHSRSDRAEEPGRGREPGQDRGRDQDRDADQRLGRSVGSAAFMRALEQVMERDNVPQQLRPEIRTVAAAQFAALRAESKTARVRLVDRQAPRQVPVQLPRYEVKRASQERAR